MESLRRPLIVSDVPLDDDVDVAVAGLVCVPWSLHAFERVSLFPDATSATDGTAADAAAVMLETYATHDRLVLLGDGVCRAFRLDVGPLETVRARGRSWFHLPYPWPSARTASLALMMFLDGPTADPRCGVG